MSKKIKYRVVKRGVTISKHYTMKGAKASQRKHYGSRISKVKAVRKYKKKTYKRRY